MSLESDRKLKRIELKFRLEPNLSDAVRDWARDHLGVDENCQPDSGDSYSINTLYLDTAERDIFHRTGRIGAAKHRIRRYGSEQTVWLETKRKKKMVVRKNRTAVFESDYLSRSTGKYDDAWCGNWFLDRVTSRGLQPAIQISYQRFARVATIDGREMRLTIDSEMKAGDVHACNAWNVASQSNSVDPSGVRYESVGFGDCEILELKFHDTMPPLFKKLLQTFTLPSTGFSKYRTAIRAVSPAEPVYG
ncbi:MAG: polyphosphate polymerase domain-containing protein [Planctomycetota bacterium]